MKAEAPIAVSRRTETPRSVSVAFVWLCLLAVALAVGATPAGAVTQFGKGEFESPTGLAIEQASGDVYVANGQEESYHGRAVQKFTATGEFLLEWGSEGTGAGKFGYSQGAGGVAVDNELGGMSYGDVYVADRQHYRVEKFGPNGNFLLMFGKGVNEGTGGDVCLAGEACTVGSPGPSDGQFDFISGPIAVGPDERVYVGDNARIEVFEPTGVWRESISTTTLSSTGTVEALAVDGSGDIFVQDSGAPGVHEFEPDGVEKPTQFDAGSTTVDKLTVNSAGDVFVGDRRGGFHVIEYDATGTELTSFASNTLVQATAMTFSETSGELYVGGYHEVESPGIKVLKPEAKVWIFSVPPPGPSVEPGSLSAVPAPKGKVTFSATIEPAGGETSYHFEYVEEALFQASGYAQASSTPAGSVEANAEKQQVSQSPAGLAPGVTYHYRLVIANPAGTVTTEGQPFTETPAALIEGPWVTNVTATSATLSASVDPLGAATEYRLEWGTSVAYGHTLSGDVGEGTSFVQFGRHYQELEPDTIYHYRLVTISGVGTIEGPDHTFTTQRADGGLALPDGRSWELVSPPNKKGALIEPFHAFSVEDQAAEDGNGIAYQSVGPAVGSNPTGRSIISYLISKRGHGGWESADISLPRRSVNEGQTAKSLVPDIGGGIYYLFSPDLTSAVAEPTLNGTPPLSPQATERTPYIRDNENDSFLPLVTAANVPEGTAFGGEELVVTLEAGNVVVYVAATPDLSHVLVSSPFALVPEASVKLLPYCKYQCGIRNLYEWSAGELQLVNVLPDGAATQGGANGSEGEGAGANLGGEQAELGGSARAISTNGRWVAWTWGAPYREGGKAYAGLYIRDMVEHKTLQIGGAAARYQTMSSDGSRVFFLENGELYEFDTATDTQTDLTSDHAAGEENAGVQESVSDVSEDGSYVYFVATGVLADGGVSGKDNLYLLHYSGGEWSTKFIAVLSTEDEKDWYQQAFGYVPGLAGVTSRVSPNGRYLAFMSNRSLTGYDNTDAVNGKPDEEVYLYDSLTDRLVCASCTPTGERPVGLLDSAETEPLVDRNEVWGTPTPHWLAGSIPTWEWRSNSAGVYQPRYLSNGGRLFFDSPDALVSQDTNGTEDVYEYEPPKGPGTAQSHSCTTTSVTFSERTGGCVSLISSGTSSGESIFYDASESGDDVFFITASKLVASDYDTAYDMYDAHVCSAEVPCTTEPVSPPPCTSGDSCKVAPSPQPEIFGPTPSATFSGVGNVIEEAKNTTVKKKSKAKHKKQTKRKKRQAKSARKTRLGRVSRMGGRR